MYVVNGSDGRCIVAVRLIVGVRYLERFFFFIVTNLCISIGHTENSTKANINLLTC